MDLQKLLEAVEVLKQLVDNKQDKEEVDVVKYKPGEKYIIRTYSSGVFYGEIEWRKGQEGVIKNFRRIWYWDGAFTLSKLAMDGTSKPESCKFSCYADRLELPNIIEVLHTTEKARKSIEGVKEWIGQ